MIMSVIKKTNLSRADVTPLLWRPMFTIRQTSICFLAQFAKSSASWRTGRACSDVGITSWRKSDYNIRQIKNSFNKVRKLKRSNSKNPDKKAQKEKQIIQAHQDYIDLVKTFFVKIESTLQLLSENYHYKQEKNKQD